MTDSSLRLLLPSLRYRVEFDGARVFAIRTLSEFDAFHREYVTQEFYPGGTRFPDWRRLGAEFDGIEIAPYLWERRLGHDTMWYYGWDCASGVLWNPRGTRLILEADVPLNFHQKRGTAMANPRMFPIQTRARSHPSKGATIGEPIYMAAYEVYSHCFGPQHAMIDLEGRGCRGGFETGELIAFLYARGFPRSEWRQRVDEALSWMDIA